MDTLSLDNKELSSYFKTLKELGYGNLNYDALWKWSSLLYQVDLIKDKLTGRNIIEAGGGKSPVSAILSENYKVTNIDINFQDKWFPDNIGLESSAFNKVDKVPHNFLSYCRTIPSDSVDIVLDGCSIIHFDRSSENINKGLYDSAIEIKRILKPGGYFITASDCLYPDNPRDIKPNYGEMLYPERFFECVESTGLKSIYGLKIKCRPNAELVSEKPGPQHYKLYSEIPIEGWTTPNGLRLSILRGTFIK